MVVAALNIPDWIFLVLIILFLIGSFSDSIFGLFLVGGIILVVVIGFMVFEAGEGLHNTFGWPTDHLIETDFLSDTGLEQKAEYQEPFYAPEPEPGFEYR